MPFQSYDGNEDPRPLPAPNQVRLFWRRRMNTADIARVMLVREQDVEAIVFRNLGRPGEWR